MVSKSSSKAKEKQVTMASATRSDNNANASSSGGASMHGKVQSIVSENFAAETEGGSGSGSGRTVQGVVKKIQERKEKRLTSKIWNHFTRSFVDVREGDKVVKKKMAECHYCKIVLSADSSKGTTRLWNHYNAKHNEQSQLNVTKLGEGVNLDAWKYDEELSVHKYHLAIVMHEYPFNFSEHEYTNDFIKSLCPAFPIKCCKTTKTRIMDIFVKEKQKLFQQFSSLTCRFSCTMDMWTSNQTKGYLCVTCHWIDDDWKIQKRIINFMHLEGKHSGVNLSTAFMAKMAGWNIEHKLFALTLDNASSNDVCVKTVISTLENHDSLLCHGKFFHVCCAAHIINLVARDGVNTISSVINNICSSVLVAKSSTMQWEIFLKQAEDLGLYTKKGLALDVSTRWNSTYLMLADALHYKKVFQRLVLLYPEKYSRHAPSREDWEKASVLCMCLKILLNVTKLLSGSYYPTANLFFVQFSEINIQLIEWTKGSDGFIVAMAKAMQDKFNKYWEMSNIALAVSCFLDPRYKMKVVEFYYELMCDNSGIKEIDEFRKVVKELFDSYASLYTNPAMSIMHPPGRAHQYVDPDDEPKKRKLDDFLNDICEVHQEQFEMDKYCSEPLLRWPKDEHFDILSWWKTQGVKYPILARLARDVLAIPASTVASESAFSTGGRVIDKYRSRLDPEVVEGLICTKDWIRASRKDQSEVASIREDLDISEINNKVEQDEGGYSSATGDGNDMDVEEN